MGVILVEQVVLDVVMDNGSDVVDNEVHLNNSHSLEQLS